MYVQDPTHVCISITYRYGRLLLLPVRIYIHERNTSSVYTIILLCMYSMWRILRGDFPDKSIDNKNGSFIFCLNSLDMQSNEQSVLSLPNVAPSLAGALIRAGYRTVGDLRGAPADTCEFARHLRFPSGSSEVESQLDELLTSVRADASASSSSGVSVSSHVTALGGQSAYDMYTRGKSRRSIITFCSKLDKLLGGGVPLGEVTEFCGVPGVGKTQMSMQLAVCAQIPAAFGGAAGEVLYVDTEGSFTSERAKEMASALASHLRRMAKQRKSASLQNAAAAVSWETLLAGIHLCRITDYAELLALVRALGQILDQPERRGRIKLVVIDSIAFHFRHGFTDLGLRARLLMAAAQALNELASSRELAVVLVNQVTTAVSAGQGQGQGQGQAAAAGGGGSGATLLKPALGESWSHAASNRVMLSWRDGGRVAELVKSTAYASAAVPYEVNTHGVRDRKSKKAKRKRSDSEHRLVEASAATVASNG